MGPASHLCEQLPYPADDSALTRAGQAMDKLKERVVIGSDMRTSTLLEPLLLQPACNPCNDVELLG
eukprot:9282376-Karenia_brevis.AAC.1